MNCPYLKYPLVCFDLDGTLVDDTVYIWKTLHESFRTDPVARQKAHDDYFSGVISYKEWFEGDLRLLSEAGATKSGILRLLRTLKPMRGSLETLLELRSRGHICAVISGSLDIVVEELFQGFVFDHMLINRILFDDCGGISGGIPTEYDLEGKARGLKELCCREGLSTSEAAFIGDNANDVWIAGEAGFSIAFNCKSDELRAICDAEVVEKDLRRVLPLLS